MKYVDVEKCCCSTRLRRNETLADRASTYDCPSGYIHFASFSALLTSQQRPTSMSGSLASSGTAQSPIPKRVQAPRTTSQLSTVSVEAHPVESSRPFQTQTLRARPSTTPLSGPFNSIVTASSSSTTSTRNSMREDTTPGLDEPSIKSLSISRSSTPGMSSVSSRKGKEKAVEGVDEVDIVGEITAGGSAAQGLRRLVRQNESEEGSTFDEPSARTAVEEVEPPDSESLEGAQYSSLNCTRPGAHPSQAVLAQTVFRPHKRRQDSLHIVRQFINGPA